MKRPFISVLMATHNYGRFIGEAIGSVLSQTYGHFELIIVDDASTDDTLEIVKGYDDKRIKLIARSECTCSGDFARNDGLAIIKGDFIAIVDADDVCLPDRFEKQIDFLNAYPDVGLLGGAQIPMDELGHLTDRIETSPVYDSPELYRRDLLSGRGVTYTPTWMFRRSILDKVPGFHGYPIYGDRVFLMQTSRYFRIYNLEEVLIYRRVHPNSVTKTFLRGLKDCYIRIILSQEYLWAQKEVERLKRQ